VQLQQKLAEVKAEQDDRLNLIARA